jgi:hypothetical protein
MTWDPSDDVDQSVREWMKARGWEVTRTNWDSDREIYAWHHEVAGGPSPKSFEASVSCRRVSVS